MSKFKLAGAALVFAAFVAAPASAQEAISEPGAYAFYHPNADVLNAGRPTLVPGAFASSVRAVDSMAQMRMSAPSHRTRHMTRHY